MKIGSLFTGAGGLDMAVEAAFGAETLWRSDIKPAACKLIEHYWPGQADPGEQLARMARHGLDSIREATEVYQACIAREGL